MAVTKTKTPVRDAIRKATAGTGAAAKIDAKEAQAIADAELKQIANAKDPMSAMMTYSATNERLAKQTDGSKSKKILQNATNSSFGVASDANTRIAERKAEAITQHVTTNSAKLGYPFNAFKGASTADFSSDRTFVAIDLDKSKLKKGDLLKAPDGSVYPNKNVYAAFEKLLKENSALRLPESQFFILTVDGKHVEI